MAQLAVGQVWHQRFSPREHSFRYDFMMLLLPLQRASERFQRIWFGRQFSPIKVRDADYLSHLNGDLLTKLQAQLGEMSVHGEIAQAELLTLPRFLGYAFNPVSFFLVQMEDETRYVLLEVANTFGEKYPYLCRASGIEDQWSASAQLPKNFYVSPFNQVLGSYEFSLCRFGTELQVGFDLLDSEGKKFFNAGVKFELQEFTLTNVLSRLMQMPATWILTTVRILVHASMLYFKLKLPYVQQPTLDSKGWKHGPAILLQRVLTGKWLLRLQQNIRQH